MLKALYLSERRGRVKKETGEKEKSCLMEWICRAVQAASAWPNAVSGGRHWLASIDTFRNCRPFLLAIVHLQFHTMREGREAGICLDGHWGSWIRSEHLLGWILCLLGKVASLARVISSPQKGKTKSGVSTAAEHAPHDEAYFLGETFTLLEKLLPNRVSDWVRKRRPLISSSIFRVLSSLYFLQLGHPSPEEAWHAVLGEGT